MKKKLNHANHNEKVCDYLYESKSFNDWVVTTAFYSALHYVEYDLFPLNDKGVEYPSFSSYNSSVMRPRAMENDLEINKHGALIDLVKEMLPESVYFNYKFLYDLCMNARYNSYKVSYKLCSRARDKLHGIKEHLSKLSK